MKEPILEPLLRKMRIKKVLPTIGRYPECRLLDLGCGWDNRLLKTVEPYIKSGVGIDGKVVETQDGKITTLRMMLGDALPFAAESFEVVTLLAVLEHLSEPLGVMQEIARVLKREGRLVITAPSRRARPLLEFLSYRLHIVNRAEIRDHKRYYDRNELAGLVSQSGMTLEHHRYFEMGMNNYCVAKK